jgi:hypothetical protein
MKMKILLTVAFALISSIAFADGVGNSGDQGTNSVRGVLVDARSTDGYIEIQSPQGVFAFDETTMTPSLRAKIQACLNRDTTAYYNDRGMLDQLVNLRCN